MTEQSVLTQRIDSHVLRVTINRPEKRNAVNAAVAAGIDRAVKLAEDEPSIRSVVLCSTGDQSFCAGADLAEVAAGKHAGLVTADGGFAGIVEAKRTKPWIAAVDAQALGGGTEICLACDLIVASERARFGLPEVKRGLFAGAGGVFRLARRIPPSVAYELLITGEAIDATRAYMLGLVNRVVPPGQAESAALSMAAQIAENAPLAVQQSLAVARLAQDQDESTLFDSMRKAGAVIRTSEDAKEGTRAFLEKRKPVWSGR
jgi:enoyl-CoA hydratase/carnithine racemase